MSHDIYDIIRRLDESLNPQQKSVPQLPALFKPRSIAVLGTKTDPQHPMKGYVVGTSESIENESEESNPMRRAVMHRIVNQHPEWITKYGAEALVQAIDDVTEGDTEWEEIGSSDVSAYVNYVQDALRDRMGGREEMDDRKPFAEVDANPTQTNTATNTNTNTTTSQPAKPVAPADKNKYNQVAQQINQARKSNQTDRVKQLTGQLAGMTGNQGFEIDARGDIKPMAEGQATEDILSNVKKKLGDYLQDVATAIQKDPDLKDKIPQDIDQVKAVKTITTDDGHEIKIHGNEDDGFRISIKNREMPRPFKTLDEATMACEMYCSKRRNDMLNADYMEER